MTHDCAGLMQHRPVSRGRLLRPEDDRLLRRSCTGVLALLPLLLSVPASSRLLLLRGESVHQSAPPLV